VERKLDRIFGESYTETEHDLENGWMYVECSQTSGATEALEKAESDWAAGTGKFTDAKKEKYKATLRKMEIYNKSIFTKDDIEHWEDIKHALRATGHCEEPECNRSRSNSKPHLCKSRHKWVEGEHKIIRVKDTLIDRSNFIALLKVQLGNPDVTHEHRKRLAVLIENDGNENQVFEPRFYAYDDKPSFNLVSGIMQAREDLWEKKSIIKLTDDVEQLQHTLHMTHGGGSGTIDLHHRVLETLLEQVSELRAST